MIPCRSMSRAYPTATRLPSPSYWKCGVVSTTTPMPPKFRQAWTMTRPGSGPQLNCLRSHSRIHPTIRLAQPIEYNNTNYLLLTLVAEKVDGKPLAQSMQDRLFGPLHLQHTLFPAPSVNALPAPYSHGYLYGSASVAMVGTPPYSPEVQAAARAGTLLPKDYTDLNHSFVEGAGAVISTANDLATWIEALVSGRVLNAAYQRRWLDSLQLEDPSKPKGQKYGYGIIQISWGPNTIYFHGGETPGYNSFMGHDLKNDVTLVVWTNLTVSLDEKPTANTIMLKVLDQIYVVSPLAPQP